MVYLGPQMTRYRQVTRTTTASGTEEHVSSVVQTFDEACAGIDVERQLARETGWHTAVRGPFREGCPYELVCTREGIVRTLTIRRSGPFDDTL